MLGPSLKNLVTATQTPTSAATIGMNHTTESRVRFLDTTLESGTAGLGICGSGMLNLVHAGGVPDEPRVERFDRQHREYDHGREKQQTGRRLHRHQRLQLNQSRSESIDKDIDHRPASDELDGTIEADTLFAV